MAVCACLCHCGPYSGASSPCSVNSQDIGVLGLARHLSGWPYNHGGTPLKLVCMHLLRPCKILPGRALMPASVLTDVTTFSILVKFLRHQYRCGVSCSTMQGDLPRTEVSIAKSRLRIEKIFSTDLTWMTLYLDTHGCVLYALPVCRPLVHYIP